MKTTTLSPWLTLAVLWPWWAWRRWRYRRALARAEAELVAVAAQERVRGRLEELLEPRWLRQGRSPWDERWGSQGGGFYDDED